MQCNTLIVDMFLYYHFIPLACIYHVCHVVTKQVVKGLQETFLSNLIESNYVFSWGLKRYFVFQTCLILIHYKIFVPLSV